MTTLVTGAAGFIGSSTAAALLERGESVIGLDNLNDYYDIRLKHARLDRLEAISPSFEFFTGDVASDLVGEIVSAHGVDRIVHLAAQAGVRHSLEHPETYVSANVMGFLKVLEAARAHPVEHLVYASTSSVYGTNTSLPFTETDTADHPVSLYAATKRSNELMAHSYSHLFDIPTTGLRFFTVYGPWGRPDMALFLFTQRILAGEPITLFNYGKHRRDFTYIDDIVEGITRVLDQPPSPQPAAVPHPGASPSARYRVFNIGSNAPIELMRYVELLEENLGRKATIEFEPMQPGDIEASHASVDALDRAVGYRPATPIEVGIARFVEWYRDYYRP